MSFTVERWIQKVLVAKFILRQLTFDFISQKICLIFSTGFFFFFFRFLAFFSWAISQHYIEVFVLSLISVLVSEHAGLNLVKGTGICLPPPAACLSDSLPPLFVCVFIQRSHLSLCLPLKGALGRRLGRRGFHS